MQITRVSVVFFQTGMVFFWALIAVFLVSLGLAVAVEVESTKIRREKEKELLAIGRQFRAAIRTYYEAPNASGQMGEHPRRLEDLLEDVRHSRTRRHLRKIFVDPMTGHAQWGVLLMNDRIVGIYSLSDAVPLKQDGFEAEDLGNRGAQTYSMWVFGYAGGLVTGSPISAR